MKNLVYIALFLLPSLLNAQDAKEIIQKSEEIFRGTSSLIEMKMTIERPKWTREMEMKAYSKGDEYSMIYVLRPKREKGTSFLKRDKEIWNWVPNIERVVKMPPSMMMQNWMGSDFTNDDLVRSSSIIDDYDQEIVATESIEDRACYVIELIPKPDAPVVWGKVKTWISKIDYLQLKVEFYDEDDFLINVMQSSNIKEMDGRIIPTKMVITPQEDPDNKTIIEYQNMQFDIEIDADFFNQRNMKRIQ